MVGDRWRRYIGAHVVRALRCCGGYGVVVVDDLSSDSVDGVGADVARERGPVPDRALLLQVLRDHQVDAVMHLAARKSVPESMIDPRHRIRDDYGMLTVVEAMKDAGVGCLVLASSAALYGESASGRVEEDAPLVPSNPYGEIKLACEWIARDFVRVPGLRSVSLRYINVAGAEASPVFAPVRAGDPADVVASEWSAASPRRDGVVIPLRARHEPGGRRDRVVVVSASVGAGHNGAAREWASRLELAGYRVEVHDFLDLLPARVGAGMNRAYELILRWAPWAYELIYRAFERRLGADSLSRALLARFRGRLADLVDDDTVAVLSTYPLASQMLGQLRKSGALTIPTATFLTDSSVHRLWVSRDVDVHFALHAVAADQAARIGARQTVVSGPLVPGRFGPGSAEDRRAARAAFGLPADGRLALLVAGSWGVGDVEKTALDILRGAVATPVIVCGRNEKLRERLTDLGIGYPLGWVSEMPTLLHAVDVLIENAGGLSSLEAMAAQVPVVTYRPIPGHGRTNAAALQAAGVARYVTRTRDLAPAMRELLETAAGADQVARARKLFDSDPLVAFERLVHDASEALEPAEDELAARRARGSRRRGRAIRAGAAAVVMALAGTVGTDIAVADGFGAIRAGKGTTSYLIVHPGPTTPMGTAAIASLRQTGASVAVDSAFIRDRPEVVSALSDAGVPIINAAGGPPYRTGLIHGRGTIRTTATGIADRTEKRPDLYLSGRKLDAADLAQVVALHERVVQASVTLTSAQPADRLPSGHIALVECSPPNAACDLPSLLTAFDQRAAAAGFTLGSVESLRHR
ncbi:MAG: NAD-dependent epimerase/dehydratase family protein [Marmoricola sp.]